MKIELGKCWALLLRLAEANGDRGYAEFVTRWPFSYYHKRIQQIGFVGFNDVLDVGCGNGQWMLALAAQNKNVIGIDPHAKRVETANALFQNLWVTNARARVGSALQLEFSAQSFDAVFCYGVFMFLDRQAALAEFHRVLRPGGKLYICTNSRGWWLKLALSKMFTNRSMAKVAWRAFRQGRKKGLPNTTDLVDMALLRSNHWSDIHAAAEGKVKLDESADMLEPVYPSKFLGYDCVIEFVATKKTSGDSGSSKEGEVPAFLGERLSEILSAKNYSFEAQLRRYKFEDQSSHSANATNPFAVEHAIELSHSIDRADALRYIYKEIIRDIDGEEPRFLACIEFAKRAFYHHFGLQPMVGDNQMLFDPIASLLFGACRCGNVARFIVDLFLVNGIQARLLAGGCHTTAEARVGDRWVLADASLFPPGIIPRTSAGLLSVDDVVANHAVLDSWPSYIHYNALHIMAFREEYPETFSTIEKWLRRPILPSVALFGREFAGAGTAGYLRRWTKNGNIDAWNAADDFGWGSLSEVEGIAGPSLETIQRPEQVQEIERVGRDLTWIQPKSDHLEEVVYSVYVSETSRNWNYSSIPVHEAFVLPGIVFAVSSTHLELPKEFTSDRLYISIVASIKGFPHAFALPSDEYFV